MTRRWVLVSLFGIATAAAYVTALRGLPNNPAVYGASSVNTFLSKTNKSGGAGCASCHGSSQDTTITVSLSGPANLYPGQTATYTLTSSKTVASGTTLRVGFDIEADDAGSLSLDPNEPKAGLLSGQIVHCCDISGLKAIMSTTPTVTHTFNYTLPTSATLGSTHTLYAVTAVGFNSGVGYWRHASNFGITAVAPPAPTSLTATALAGTSYSLSWTGASPEFRAIYKAGSVPTSATDGTLITEGTSRTTTVNGLTGNTRYFIAVYGKASGVAVYSTSAVNTSVITPNAQQIDANSRAGSGRTSNTSQGQLLFVDDPANTDVVKLFNGSTVLTIEPKGTGQNVDFDDFGLGNAATAGHVIAVWRRDTDPGHLSVDGGTPVLIVGVNPINAAQSMNLEGLAIADGCVFAVLQAFSGGNAIKNVYKVDPGTGNAGNSLTGTAAVPGVAGRVRTSGCKAVWAFDNGGGNTNLLLQYYNGTSVQTLDTGVSDPWISQGKIVYVKPVGGVAQVFLYDTTAASPAPVQLTSYTDATRLIHHPQTDGRHVAWYRSTSTNTSSEIDLGTGLQLASPVGVLSTEPEFQLNRGQLFWKDSGGNFRYETATSSSVLPLPSTTFRPWLTDGYIAYGDNATPGAFLLTGTPPNDAQQPAAPLVLRATAGTNSATLTWDAILGATSYTVYYAQLNPGQAAITKSNYSTLPGGTRVTGITGTSTTINGLAPNQSYTFIVTTVDPTGEGPASRSATATVIGNLSWIPVGNQPTTTFYVAAPNGNTAYASGGNNTYSSSDGGVTWTALNGGIAGVNVHALAVNGSTFFATSPTGSIYRSFDGGSTWTTVLTGAGIGEFNQSIAIDPASPNTIYAGDFRLPNYDGTVDSHVIRSDDGGTTWFHLPEPTSPFGADPSAYSMAIDPTRTTTLYIGGAGTPNMAKSITGGAGWIDAGIPASGFPSCSSPAANCGYVYTVAVDPNNPLTIYAGIETNFGAVNTKGVWKSLDGGGTWTAINNGLGGQPAVRSVVVDPLDSNFVHLGTEVGYFYSTSGGASWTAANTGLPNASAQFIYALALTSSRHLIAATAAGLYLLNVNPPPAIASISPTVGNTTGGTSVTISGSGFQPGATVTFGGTAATNVTVVNVTTVTATTPAHTAGAVDVVVTNFDTRSSTLAGGFTYATTPPPGISGVSPSSGSTLGGTSVTISGSNFVSGATVTLGGTAATNVVVSSAATITASTPAHAAGAVSVVVRNPDGQSATLTNGFTYIAPPTISGVSPTSGPEGGGTAVTITGSGFSAGATVTFGGTAGTNVVVSSATTITVSTPAHAPGAVDVVVRNADGQGATVAGAFIYIAAPHITSIFPSSGPPSGGTSVSISGTGFLSGATVTFGGTAATNVTVVSATSITATTPAHTAGLADVVVRNPDGQSATLAGGFSFTTSPHGDANGDGQVTVTDVFYLINYLFAGGPAPIGPADVNGDGQITVADIFYLINYLFSGGPAPR